MEGTPHERAALVGVAYFLGFLTTFIWLGFNQSTPVIDGSLPVSVGQSAAVVQAVPAPQERVVGTVSSEQPSIVTYANGLLEVNTLGTTRLLSFNPDVTGMELTDDFYAQGAHYDEVIYSTSPTQEYVFFCEMKEIGAETCLPFVYDTLSEMIYPVRKDGDRVELLTSAAQAASWQGNQLVVGGEIAQDPAKPWLLGLQ
jgi:hypothetical protein